MTTTRPTPQTYADWQTAFDHFNTKLWGGKLPDCIITLRNHANSFGYFSKQRFINGEGKMVDEIAINSGYLALRPVEISLSTLAHEMVHDWQAHYGKVSRKSYHNAEFATEMERIGLCPSATGLPGGRRTGQQMTHYIIDGGLFEKTVSELLTDGWNVSWMDRILAMEPEAYQSYLKKLSTDIENNQDEVEFGNDDLDPDADIKDKDGDEVSSKSALLGIVKTAPSSKKAGRPKRAPPTPLKQVSVSLLSQMPITQAAPAFSKSVDEGGEPEPQSTAKTEPINTFVKPSQRVKSGSCVGTSNRMKFVCPECTAAAWGKPDLKIICGVCNRNMGC